MALCAPSLKKMKLPKTLFLILCVLVLFPFYSAGLALVTGVVLSLLFGNPYLEITKKWTSHLLQVSVVGLGAAMDLLVVARVGMEGIGYTVIGISLTLVIGIALGRTMKARPDASLLITVGTAICGGSAIAAVAPAIRAKSEDVSVSLATVFLLNALALFLFPWIGHKFDLTQTQFGLWSALAIHDTSSVVGSAMQFGTESLQVATTVKLARALWIVPLTLGIGYFYRGSSANGKKPWFILGFVLAAALVTWMPELRPIGENIAWVSKRLLVLTLFLIGTGISKAALKTVGIRPLVLGSILWCLVSAATLYAILFRVL